MDLWEEKSHFAKKRRKREEERGEKRKKCTNKHDPSTRRNIAGKGCEKVAMPRKMCYNGRMEKERAEQALAAGESGEKFAAFYDMLVGWNKKFNITRILDRDDCYKKHFYDSLTGEGYFPQNARCAEVGSGGGFPSIPLMIVRSDLHFDLFESSQKKCAFLCAVVDKLKLPAAVHAVRAEGAGRDKAFRERFDVCTARAVARLATLAEYCAPLIRVGGRFVAYKARAEEEIAEAGQALRLLGLRQSAVEEFCLDGGERRTLFVAEKECATPAKYPRGRGKERSDPLGCKKRGN